MGKQPVFTPPISNCHCGAKAKVIDWNFRMAYRVMCDKNHVLTGEFNTVNRAVHRWNNRTAQILATPSKWRMR